MEHGVTLTEIVQKMNLKNLTPNVELVGKEVNIPDVNRPALQLAGFFEHFDSDRGPDHRIRGVYLSADSYGGEKNRDL